MSDQPVSEDPRVVRSKTRIRAAALAELADNGFGGFGIESVAARAGVGKATVYRHWADHADLVVDALTAAHHDAVPAPAGTGRDHVLALVRHVAEVLRDSTFSRVVPALVDAAERDDRIRAVHHGYSAHRRGELAAAVSAGTTDGSIAPGTDPDTATTLLLGVLFHHRLMTGDPLPPDDAPALVDTVLGEGPRVVAIGRVSSPITDPGAAPRQGDEGGAEAWVVFGDDYREAARDLAVDDEILLLTWLHRADRDTLVVHPRDDPAAPLRGVFATRSADRPNPIGLHRVTVTAAEPGRIRVRDLEAVDGTPVLDVKPVLTGER